MPMVAVFKLFGNASSFEVTEELRHHLVYQKGELLLIESFTSFHTKASNSNFESNGAALLRASRIGRITRLFVKKFLVWSRSTFQTYEPKKLRISAISQPPPNNHNLGFRIILHKALLMAPSLRCSQKRIPPKQRSRINVVIMLDLIEIGCFTFLFSTRALYKPRAGTFVPETTHHHVTFFRYSPPSPKSRQHLLS